MENKFEHWWHMAGILYRPTLQALQVLVLIIHYLVTYDIHKF